MATRLTNSLDASFPERELDDLRWADDGGVTVEPEEPEEEDPNEPTEN